MYHGNISQMKCSWRNLIIISLCAVCIGEAKAQNANELLSRSFWKGNPNIATIQTSIDQGNDPTELDRFSFDALSYALIEDASEDILDYLIELPGNGVNKMTHDERTYIFWAAYRSNLKFMEKLVSRGAEVDIVDGHGYSLLNFAAVTGQTDTTLYNYLIALGSRPSLELNRNGANALLLVSPFIRDRILVDYFQGHGIRPFDMDEDGANLFHYASKGGDTDFLQELAQMGFEPTLVTNDGRNAGHFAAMATRGKSNDLALYQFLDSLGVDLTVPCDQGKTPLMYCVAGNPSLEVLDFLTGLGTNLAASSRGGENALIMASSRHSESVLEKLISPDFDLNQTDDEGRSCLSNAVRNNSSGILEFLLQNGASSGLLYQTEGSLLNDLAIAHNRDTSDFWSKSKLLIADGFSLSAPQKNGNTLFHLAVENEDIPLCEVAVQFGVDIDFINRDGYSALHLAAMQSDSPEMIQLLISLGAEKSLMTPFEETAFHLVNENERLNSNRDIQILLKP